VFERGGGDHQVGAVVAEPVGRMSEASSAIARRQALRLFGGLRLRLTRPTKNAFAVPDVAALIRATDRDKSRRCD